MSLLADRDIVLCLYYILSCSLSLFLTFHSNEEECCQNLGHEQGQDDLLSTAFVVNKLFEMMY